MRKLAVSGSGALFHSPSVQFHRFDYVAYLHNLANCPQPACGGTENLPISSPNIEVQDARNSMVSTALLSVTDSGIPDLPL
jgi:hypothetical protein